MEKLRLAVFNTQPPLFLGGVERRILETAHKLQGEVSTTVYSGTKTGLRKARTFSGVTLVPCFSTDFVFPLDNWTFNQTLSRNADRIKADVYEVHTASGYGLLSAFQKQHARVASVHTIHGVLADEYVQAYLRGGHSARSKLANVFMWQLSKKEEESARKATLIVTISKYSQGKILQHYDVDQAKIRIVPNGVDTARFKPGEAKKFAALKGFDNRQIVLFVGRLIPRKGLFYLVEAAKQVVKENRDALFVLVGNGPIKNRLVSEVKVSGLEHNFVFLGDVSEEALPEIYRCADVFAFPSIQEGQGIVLLEAQASAKPVVAFDVSGVSEAVRNHESGLLVEVSSRALAQAILKVLADKSLREEMGLKGREFVGGELSWDVCAQKMLSVYKEAIELA
jgi:glycosyltransferase involved in cell wall biosynthesis